MNMHENFSTEITSHYRNPVLSQMYNCHTKTTIDMSTLCFWTIVCYGFYVYALIIIVKCYKILFYCV